MNQDDYKAIWRQLFAESIGLAARKTEMENDLSEINAKIDNLDKSLAHIRPLAGMPVGNDLSGLGMTDAIRAVLKNAKKRMSAGEVRDALREGGFNLSGLSSLMSSIYTVLGRLADDPQEIIREKEGNQAFYRWNEPADDFAQSAEISDDDIPF